MPNRVNIASIDEILFGQVSVHVVLSLVSLGNLLVLSLEFFDNLVFAVSG